MSQRTVVRHIGELLTMDCPAEQARGAASEKLIGLVRNAALVVEGGRTAWLGRDADLPSEFMHEADVIEAHGRVVMPGLVECHTHLVFGGDRAGEFELRARGATYEEIGRSGGGIAHTVRATRASAADELFVSGMQRLDELLKMGVTTAEAKSGYGLDVETELKILEVVQALDGRHPVDLVPTFLGAHVVAPEYRDKRGEYVELVCRQMLPAVARGGLARFCDVFCEQGAFTVEEAREILSAGLAFGLVPKIHAEQLSLAGACRLAAELGAASADHLDFAGPEEASALARAGVVAVLLPGATFFLGKSSFPDGRMFLEAGAEVALSTDFNPGSSYTVNLWLMGTMACTRCRMSPAEALRAMTVGAARALRLEASAGLLAPGRKADFLLLECRRWEEILYLYGRNPVRAVCKAGRVWSI
jgi:imidazolonepropionase